MGSDGLVKAAVSMTAKVKELCAQLSPKTVPATSVNALSSRSLSPYNSRERGGGGVGGWGTNGRGSGMGVGTGGTGSGVGLGAGASRSSLVGKVRQLEGELARHKEIPEKEHYLLKDLKNRVVEVEKRMSDTLHEQQSTWHAERLSLSQSVSDSRGQVQDLKHTQENTVSAIRSGYQSMLDQAQSALELQSETARRRIDFLEAELMKYQQMSLIDSVNRSHSVTHAIVHSDGDGGGERGREGDRGAEYEQHTMDGSSHEDGWERRRDESKERGTDRERERGRDGERHGEGEREGERGRDRGRERERERSPSPSLHQSHTLHSSLLAATERSHLEEVLAIKRLAHQTSDELGTARCVLKEKESQVQGLLDEIRTHSREHEETVFVLEETIAELQQDNRQLKVQHSAAYQGKNLEGYEGNAVRMDGVRDRNRGQGGIGGGGGVGVAELSDALKEAENQIQNIENRYEEKCNELDSLKRYVSQSIII